MVTHSLAVVPCIYFVTAAVGIDHLSIMVEPVFASHHTSE